MSPMRVRTFSDFIAWLVTIMIFFGAIFLLGGLLSRPPFRGIAEGLILISSGVALIVLYIQLARVRYSISLRELTNGIRRKPNEILLLMLLSCFFLFALYVPFYPVVVREFRQDVTGSVHLNTSTIYTYSARTTTVIVLSTETTTRGPEHDEEQIVVSRTFRSTFTESYGKLTIITSREFLTTTHLVETTRYQTLMSTGPAVWFLFSIILAGASFSVLSRSNARAYVVGKIREADHAISLAFQSASRALRGSTGEAYVPERHAVRRTPARSRARARAAQIYRFTSRAPTTAVQLESIDGVLDPVTGTEFRRDDEITQCSNCGLLYHSDSRQFILEQNSGRCVGCSQSGTLHTVRAVEAVSVRTTYRADIVTLDNYQDFLGKIVYFEGRVVEVHESAKGTYFVKFVRGPIPQVFKLVIFSKYVERFSQGGRTIKRYHGRTIRVRGLIQRHEVWGWEILVSKEEAISSVS